MGANSTLAVVSVYYLPKFITSSKSVPGQAAMKERLGYALA
jgi:hypothetical protein